VLVLWDSQKEAGDSVGLVRTGACHDLELLQVLHREQVGSQGEGHHRLGGVRQKGRGDSQEGGHHEVVVHHREPEDSQEGVHQGVGHQKEQGDSLEEGLPEEGHRKGQGDSPEEGLRKEQGGSQVEGMQPGGHLCTS